MWAYIREAGPGGQAESYGPLTCTSASGSPQPQGHREGTYDLRRCLALPPHPGCQHLLSWLFLEDSSDPMPLSLQNGSSALRPKGLPVSLTQHPLGGLQGPAWSRLTANLVISGARDGQTHDPLVGLPSGSLISTADTLLGTGPCSVLPLRRAHLA